jgi:membrane protease YdiL (CAAX protease family)
MRLKELRMDWKVVTTIVVSTLALVVHHEHDIFKNAPYDYDGLLLYLAVPLLIILLVFRESPARYGFRLGDWKAGLVLTTVSCAGLALVMTLVARTEAFQKHYGGAVDDILSVVIANGVTLLGWEFVFRGFLLFALYRVCGPYAIVLQAVPFTIAHFGKPELETLSCIFGGSVFGYIAWRTRSFLYPFLIHWFLTTITVLFASGVIG